MAHFKLYINFYHNPVSQTLTLSFTLSQTKKMSIELLDLMGRVVKKLSDAHYNPGENKLLWDVSDLSEGIYFLNYKEAELSKGGKFAIMR